MKITKEKMIMLNTENKIGIAGKVTDNIAKSKVNIKAIWAGEMNGAGQFFIVTDNNAKAMQALDKANFNDFVEQEVLVARVPDTVGSCANVATKLGDAGINIHQFFSTIFDKETALFLSTDDNQKAMQVLK